MEEMKNSKTLEIITERYLKDFADKYILKRKSVFKTKRVSKHKDL